MFFLEVLLLEGSFFQQVGDGRSTTASSWDHTHHAHLAVLVPGATEDKRRKQLILYSPNHFINHGPVTPVVLKITVLDYYSGKAVERQACESA